MPNTILVVIRLQRAESNDGSHGSHGQRCHATSRVVMSLHC